jgi:hypothetical protein
MAAFIWRSALAIRWCPRAADILLHRGAAALRRRPPLPRQMTVLARSGSVHVHGLEVCIQGRQCHARPDMLRVRLVRMLLLAAMVAAAVIWVLPVLLMLVGKILDQVVILLRVLLLMWVPWHSRGRRRRPQKIDGDFSLHRKAVVLFPSDAAAGTTAAMGTDNRLVSQTTHIVVSRRFFTNG